MVELKAQGKETNDKEVEEQKRKLEKEIRAQMILGWETNLDDIALVEKTLGELMKDIFTNNPMNDEEKQFVTIQCKVIADGLKRPCKVEI